MGKRIFKFSINFSISKKELLVYCSFNLPEVLMDQIIEDSLMQVSLGIHAQGSDTGYDFLTYMLTELNNRDVITLNEIGQELVN